MEYYTKRFEDWKEKWEDSSSIELKDYISFNIHPEDVLILSSLFFPSMIEVDSCIFFKSHYNPDSYLIWKNKFNNDSKAIERMVNHVHIYDVFDHCSDTISESIFEEVARLLQKSWIYYFRSLYPDKQINVEYVSGDMDYGPTLYVYQM
ncbi:MAG: hypothetical protein QM781_13075 [Chitinophagaceae bacterium]